jgi:hypothetical protein
MHIHAHDVPSYAFAFEVFCDGQKLLHCIEACEEGGWARCHFLNDHQRLARTPDGHALALKTIYGHIVIALREGVSPRIQEWWQRMRSHPKECKLV